MNPSVLKHACYVITLFLTLSATAYAQQQKDAASRADSTKGKAVRADWARKIPEPIGWINDYTFLFSNEEVRQLDSLVRNYEKNTTIEIVVLTIDSTRTNHKDFDEFTLLIANTWKVGKEDKKNGIFITISADLRRMRVHNGYGIEKLLSDQETKTIVDSVFIPMYKEGKYFEGTKKGIIAIMDAIASKN
ncbi:MAG TPA: TPM domain-containing protein [Chitinophagaceae bacterium]|nr:TPM domain-containing protein [Chitinophagaceae bacterium]